MAVFPRRCVSLLFVIAFLASCTTLNVLYYEVGKASDGSRHGNAGEPWEPPPPRPVVKMPERSGPGYSLIQDPQFGGAFMISSIDDVAALQYQGPAVTPPIETTPELMFQSEGRFVFGDPEAQRPSAGFYVVPLQQGRYLLFISRERLILCSVENHAFEVVQSIDYSSRVPIFDASDEQVVVYTDSDQFVFYSVPDLQETKRLVSPFDGDVLGMALQGAGRDLLYAAVLGEQSLQFSRYSITKRTSPEPFFQGSGRPNSKYLYQQPPMLEARFPLPANSRVFVTIPQYQDYLLDWEKEWLGTETRHYLQTHHGYELTGGRIGLRPERRLRSHGTNLDQHVFMNPGGNLALEMVKRPKRENEAWVWSGRLVKRAGWETLRELRFRFPREMAGFATPQCLFLPHQGLVVLLQHNFCELFALDESHVVPFLKPETLVVVSTPPDSPRLGQRLILTLKVWSGSGNVVFESLIAPVGFEVSESGIITFEPKEFREVAEPVVIRVTNEAGGEALFSFEI